MKSSKFIIPFILICLFFTTSISAQETDRKRFVGGNLSFQLQGASKSNEKLISYSVAPTFGTFATDKIVAGASVGFQGAYAKYNTGFGGIQEERTSFVFVNPFVRFRIPAGDKLGFYTELDLFVGGEFAKLGSGNNSVNLDPAIRSGFHVGPGMDYRFSDRWFFNIKWGIFGLDTYKIVGEEQFNYNLGFDFDTKNLIVGINYLL